jgi:hypothetical protein
MSRKQRQEIITWSFGFFLTFKKDYNDETREKQMLIISEK